MNTRYFKDSSGQIWGFDEGQENLIRPDMVEIPKPEEPSIPPPTYAELRAAEYPDFREYLDGIVKGDQAQIDAYVAACLAVKAKYPKPAE